ncbi:heterodisulfide reductase-related iron-sulfur binding cluster [Chloroflexota bacterium]
MSTKVAYFSGCFANYNDPDIGKATFQVLERHGLQPIFPEQVCCGMPKLRQGNIASAMKNARSNLRSLIEADCEVVTTCITCTLALKHYYPYFLQSPEAELISQRTYNISEYLARLHAQGALDTSFNHLDISVLYHAPCHVKSLGQDLIDSRLRLMNMIPGISATRIDRGCCGMAGTFAAKRATYPLTVTIAQGLLQGIKESAPDEVATDCPTCKLQIEQGTGCTVIHPIQLFQRAYGL